MTKPRHRTALGNIGPESRFGLLTLLSRISGLAREVALVAALGTTVFADTYNIANALPILIYSLLIGGPTDALLLPRIVNHMDVDADQGRRFIGASLTAAAAAGAGIAVVVAATSSLIIAFTAPPSWGAESQSVANLFLVLAVPQFVATGLYEVANQALIARGQPLAIAAGPLVSNMIVISGYVAFGFLENISSATTQVPRIHLLLLGLLAPVGLSLQALWSVLRLKQIAGALPINLSVVRRSKTFIKRDALPIALLLLIHQTSYFIIIKLSAQANISGGASSRGFTTYQKAFQVFQLPHAAITMAFVTLSAPLIARKAVLGPKEIAPSLQDLIGKVAGIILPISAFMCASAPAAAIVLFGQNPGRRDDAIGIGFALGGFAPALMLYSLHYILTRALYSLRDSTGPLVVALLLNAVDVVGVWTCSQLVLPKYQITAFALCHSCALAIGCLVAARQLRRRHHVSLMPPSKATVWKFSLISLLALIFGGGCASAVFMFTSSWAGAASMFTGLLCASAASVLLLGKRLGLAPYRIR